MSRLSCGLTATTLVALAATATASLPDALTAGWTPAVRIWGGGDAALAIHGLRRLAHASGAMLHHTETDAATAAFSEAALDDLEDFDLRGFYRLLPEGRGGFHELRVQGELKGNRYEVRRGDAMRPFHVAANGPRHALFDLEYALRIRPTQDGRGRRDRYQIHSRLGFGAGEILVSDLVSAAVEISKTVERGDPRTDPESAPQVSAHAFARTRALNPRLGPEDLSSVAITLDAYPRVFETFFRMGEIEDVREVSNDLDYQHVRLKMRALPKRLGKHYPGLAAYLEQLDELATVNLTWSDAKGRTLATLRLDTKTLRATAESYVAAGKLLPFANGKVFVDEPVDPRGSNLQNSHVDLDLRLDLLGIILKVRGIHLDVRYAYDERSARMTSSMTRPPRAIEVEGAALGFLSPRLIDAFIPGDIHGLAMDFFRTAAEGNGGRGVQTSGTLTNAAGARDAVLDLRAALEAPDNRLVRMGVRMVNDRVLPDDAASESLTALLSDLQRAFEADLTRFQTRLPPG